MDTLFIIFEKVVLIIENIPRMILLIPLAIVISSLSKISDEYFEEKSGDSTEDFNKMYSQTLIHYLFCGIIMLFWLTTQNLKISVINPVFIVGFIILTSISYIFTLFVSRS